MNPLVGVVEEMSVVRARGCGKALKSQDSSSAHVIIDSPLEYRKTNEFLK